MSKKVLISGDRDWVNEARIKGILWRLKAKGYDTIIEGEARGADSIARDVGKSLGFIIDPYPAKWDIYHKAAGPIRNTQMLKEGKPELIVAFHDNIKSSKGTKDMLRQGLKAGIKCILVTQTTIKIITELD
jgi:hypothetical protein